MPERISLPEDYLRIGEPAANRRSVFDAIMEALRDEDLESVIPRGAVRGEATVTTPEQRRAALTTRLEIPPKNATRRQARAPEVGRAGAGAVRGRKAVPTGEGFIEWVDDKGVRHVTDKPETVPEGVEAKVIPFEEPTLEVGGQKLFGEPTPEALGVLRKAAETDEQREDRMIGEIMKETGKGRGEVTKAFRGARREISGEAAKPKTYEAKVARRDEAVANVERLIKQNPQDRNEILRQFSQKMKLEGLTGLKKPEQTISATIEGQRVDIPVSKWKPEYGTESKGKDTANIREATWLINNDIAKDEKEAYRMVRKATAKETTEREWAIDVRKNLMKGENQYLEEEERQAKYETEMEWFRNLPGKGAAPVSAKTVSPAGKVEKRRLPDGRVLVRDAKGNITVEG
ncbi:hypothetical protein KAR91_14695 [Candidatus Pacearchaeota archaeon]|nr:hypothetical protein [Candidatus Pacearchaeota archaeon]